MAGRMALYSKAGWKLPPEKNTAMGQAGIEKKFLVRLSGALFVFFALGPAVWALDGLVTISGKVKGDQGRGVSQVTILASTGQTAQSDAGGKFSLTVPRGWTGTITPQGAEILFSPPSRAFTNLNKNASQNFSGKARVTGCVRNSAGAGVSGIKISLNRGGGSQNTDQQGCFSFAVPLRWFGIITPAQKGVTISPPSMYVDPVYRPDSGNDFAAADLALSGSLLDEQGRPIPYACLWFSAYGAQKEPVRLFPDGQGRYSRSIPYAWQGTITPSRSGLAFDPPVRSYAGVRATASNQDFRGRSPQGSVHLSLQVVDSLGRPVQGAAVVLHDTNGKVALVRQTAADGRADCGTVGRLFATLTIAREVPLPDGSFSRAIDTLTEVPLSSETLVFSSIAATEEPAPLASAVTVRLPTAVPGSVEPFPSPWRPEHPVFPLFPWQVHSDGTLSLLGAEGNVGEGQERWWRYGFLLDQAWTEDAALEVPFTHEPVIIPYSSNKISIKQFSVYGQRKRVWYLLGRRSFTPPAPLAGTIRVADKFPAEEYLVAVAGDEWQTDGRLLEWYADQGFRTLPAALELTLPSAGLKSFQAQELPRAAQWAFWSTPSLDLIALTFNFRGRPGKPGKGGLTRTRWSVSLDPYSQTGWSAGLVELPEPQGGWVREAVAENAHLLLLDARSTLDYGQFLQKTLHTPSAFDLLDQTRTLNWIFFTSASARLLPQAVLGGAPEAAGGHPSSPGGVRR